MVSFLALLAVDILGLAGIFFYLKAKIRRALELDSLLDSIRKEVRALNIELNETTDRNISLIEDRMKSLHELLDEADRRMGVVKRELSRHETEREVYNHLGKRVQGAQAASPRAPEARPFVPEPSPAVSLPPPANPAFAEAGEGPIRLSLGSARPLPEIIQAEGSVIPPKSRREEALDLYRQGFSADIIAKRLGATVAEIELLVSLEEGRSRSGSDSFAN
jgi:hypothetical protein